MQLTKGAIGNLINRYKAVLKKCHLMNTFGSLAVAGMLVMGGAGVAVAADPDWGTANEPNTTGYTWTGEETVTHTGDVYIKKGADRAFQAYQTDSTKKGAISLGSGSSTIVINSSVEKGSSYGVLVFDNSSEHSDQLKLDLTGDTISISAESNDGYAGALHVSSDVTVSDKDKNNTVNIVSKNGTTIYAKGTTGASAIELMSGGILNISGPLTAKAELNDGSKGDVIYARGGATLNIGAHGETVKLDGNINFGYEGTTSGTGVDAFVNVTLTGADSYWNGNTITSWSPDKPSDEKLEVTSLKVALNKGATWTPTVVENSQSKDQQYTALNKLTLDGGIVDVNKGVAITIENIDGKGAITNAGSVTIEKGSIEGPITFEKGDAQADNMVTVDKDGKTTLTGGVAGSGTIDKLAIAEDGKTTITNAKLSGHEGRALWNNGTLTVNGGSFESNKANVAGAIYNAAGAALTVDGVTFASNSSDIAGAINNRDGQVTIKKSTFTGNDSGTKAGGAIYNASGNLSTLGAITIAGSTFEGNKAGNGGAVWNGSDGKVDIADSTFKGNTAVAEGGLGQGGAITNADQMTITGGSFANNTANYSGGAIYNGAHAAPGQTSLTIDGTTFTGNSVTADFSTTHNDKIAGGAIFNDTKAKLDVKNATFTGNTSSLKGGAIFNRDGNVTITSSTFRGNSVPTSAGGAVLNESGNTGTLGTINITGSTFEGNTAGNGGAVWNGFDGKVEIADSTFKGNTALAEGGIGQGGAITNADQMTITGSTFEGNQAGKIGGAIFNAASGKLDFNGTNTFTNNTAAGKANDIYNAGTITVAGGTTTLNSGLILAANSTTDVSGGALVINGTTTWEKGDNLGSLTVTGGALTLQKGDVLEGYDKAKENTSLSVASGALYLINKGNYTAENFTDAKDVLLKNANASFGFVGGQLVDDGGNVTGLVVSGNTIGANTKFDTDGLTDTTVNNSSFLKNDLTVKADATDVTINVADVAVNKVNIETSATGDKSLTINNNGSLTVVGGNANDKLIAANGTDDLTTIKVDEGKLNLGSAAMPERGAGTLGKAHIKLGNNGSLNASNGDYTVGDVTGTGEVTANTGANLNTGGIEALAVTADAANIKATGGVTAGDIDLVKGGSVTSDKNITVNGSIEDADGTLQAGGNITVQNDITKAGNGKLTVAAGGTIEAANISATNVAAKKLTASGDVAVDGGVLNLTGTDAADASTVKSLKLTNGTQASIAGSLQLGSGETLTVGTGDDTAGGTTLSAQHIDLNGGMLLVDPAWGLASSNVAVKDLSALSTSGAASADPALVNGSVGVGQNSYLALRTDDLTWLPGVVANYTKGVGLSETGITAALGVFDSIKIADTEGLVVDGSLTSTGLSAAIVPDTAKFGANSLLVVNGANIYGDKAAITFMSTSGGTLTVDKTSRLVVTDAVAGQDYTIVANAATVQDGTSAPITAGGTVWKTEGLSTTTDMISLGDAKHDDTNDKVTTTASRNDAHTVFPNLSDGMANAVNDLYTGHAGAAGKPNWDYADVNSDQMGVRFLSRATDNRFLGADKNAAAESIESAARIAFAGAAPQMTKMASDAGTNAVVNRLGFANPADGAQAMDAEGKIVDRNTTGFALWIAPLWQSQHGWGLDAGNMDYGFNGNLGGVSLGADYTFENAIRAGITFNIGGGYAESSGGDLSSTENRMNFWGLGAYAGWNYENFGVMADVSYTSTWNDLKQDLDSRLGMGNKLEADVQATAISAGLRAEYLLQTSAMDIIPHIGVRYMSLNTWGYDVDTHGGTVLEGDSLHQDIWTFPIGVTFSKDIALDSGWNFKPSLDFSVIPAAGDIKAKHDVHFTGLPGTYEVETQMMDYLTWQGGVGLELANDNMSIGVNYTLQAGQHTTGHGVFGSFRYEF